MSGVTASTEGAAPVMPPAQFVQRLTERGLTLHCDSGKLILFGPTEARTDRIRAYLRTQKSALLVYLAPPPAGPDVSDLASLGAEIDREIDADMAAQVGAGGECENDPKYGPRLREGHQSTINGRMPISERVALGSGGSTDDPG